MMEWNMSLNLHGSDHDVSFSMTDGDGQYQNIHGMPFKTAQEFERHYYMLGDTRMASMWTLVDELDTALSVASRLDE